METIGGETLVTCTDEETSNAVTLAIGANGDSLVTEGDGDKLATGGNGDSLATEGNGDTLATGGNGHSLATEGNGDTLATGGNGKSLATEGDGDTLATRSEEDTPMGLDTLDMEVIDESEEGLPLSYRQKGIIFITGTEFRLKGHKPHLTKPDLILGIENAVLSNGDFINREKSLLEETKIFFANVMERIDFEKRSFRDLKTETLKGCNAWVVCGGKQNKITYLSGTNLPILNSYVIYGHQLTTAETLRNGKF